VLYRRRFGLHASSAAVADVMDRISKLSAEEASALKALAGAEHDFSLGGLPLALQQAGSYMASRRVTFVEYLALFKKQFEKLGTEKVMPAAPDLGGAPHDDANAALHRKVHSTWELNVDSLKPEALRVLNAAALFAPDGMPVELLAALAIQCSDDGDEMAYGDIVLEHLVNGASLLNMEAGDAESVKSPMFSMHRMLRMFVRCRCAPMQEVSSTALTDALAALASVGNSHCMGLGALWWRRSTQQSKLGLQLVPHIISALETRSDGHVNSAIEADLYFFTAESYIFSVTFSAAEMFARKSLEMRMRIHSGDHSDIAASLFQIANVMFRTGKEYFRGSLEQHKLSLEMRRRIYGDVDCAEIGDSLAETGLVMFRAGDYDGALKHLQASLEMMRRLYGNDAGVLEIASTMMRIADVLVSKGLYESALEDHRKCLEMKIRILNNADHVIIVMSLCSIGNVLGRMGDYDGALEHFRRALEMKKRIHGEDATRNSHLVSSLQQIASVLERKGDYDSALKEYESCLEMLRRMYGDDADHSDVKSVQQAIHRLLEHKGV
jgi:tetratricopeptide (TPR) repeat protein